jgi:hypothetical protein
MRIDLPCFTRQTAFLAPCFAIERPHFDVVLNQRGFPADVLPMHWEMLY